ncbi:type IV toxin-antitoxin system AbiEi family antitoxin domain-containing protein [Sphingopyxis sp. NFH-91]|uniref:type IV toxin-antitoxin system AbiEi family antitoxin domain-containing protein n=1 Tax=Sphingopyxis sp. NFH-91 TaxID=2744457 RepID=UPI002DD436E7|nr:type IV toxin-antitoxin system AbiEi family antitoxin domain-containing protein [Sphingopyxis sp. NFH-91]
MSLRDRAAELAASRLTVRTKDFEAIGVPRHYMALMCEEGILERVGFGLYRLAQKA